MSDSTAGLRRKIASAGDLQSVVRTMKALAASSISQYEQSVLALSDYSRTVNLGLGACLRAETPEVGIAGTDAKTGKAAIGAIVFGSDQGLVGQFNDIIADHVVATLADLPGTPQVWAVGERVQARLADPGLQMVGDFAVPTSVQAIAPLVANIQITSEAHRTQMGYAQVYLFHNRPLGSSGYEPVSQRLLPLDAQWRHQLAGDHWPTKLLPQIISGGSSTLRALIREYLFISLFRACAESLASESASRLAAMQRADKNIDDLLENLHRRFHRQRQGAIDEELFDVIAGYEALGQADTSIKYVVND
jgi:F-type H+-transporting ATPase subunit gamma